MRRRRSSLCRGIVRRDAQKSRENKSAHLLFIDMLAAIVRVDGDAVQILLGAARGQR